MTARTEFDAVVRQQLDAAYRRGAAAAVQLLNGHLDRHKFAADMHANITGEHEAITRAARRHAATVTGAVLEAFGAGQDAEGPLFRTTLAIPAQREVTR